MGGIKCVSFCILFLTTSASSFAQEKPLNVVKINFLPLIGKTISVDYERAFSDSFSLNATVGILPKGKMPFRSLVEKAVESSIVDETNMGAFSLALEGRFYLNKKKGVLEGFYIAPFIKNTNFALDAKVDYSVSYGSLSINGDVPIKGHVNAFSGGVAIGMQWVFSNRLALDWRIIGLSYGITRGKLKGEKSLNTLEQFAIKKKIDDFASDLPIIKMKSEVNEEGVKATVDGPWAGVRTGLSVGYSF